jgi:hypothetical protein
MTSQGCSRDRRVLFVAGILAVFSWTGVVAASAWGSDSESTSDGFGFVEHGLSVSLLNGDGSPDVQAGSHPAQLRVEFELHSELTPEGELVPTGGQLLNTVVELPPGLVGYPGAVGECTRRELDGAGCPASSRIGETDVRTAQTEFSGLPVYNMVPPPGVPAQFAFEFEGVPAFLDATVRSSSDYGLNTNVENVPQREVTRSRTTIFGFPSEKAFLTMPTQCGGALGFGIRADTWEEPEQFSTAFSEVPAMTGCEHLGFKPSIAAKPETTRADTPTGLEVDVRMPQEGLTEPGALSESTIRATTVTLPKSVVINPGQAAGLEACQDTEANLKDSEVPPACPLASKIGAVKIASPLLETAREKELEGSVYVLHSEPPHLRLLIAASGDGVNLKLVARANLNPQTGQIITHLGENPANLVEAEEIREVLEEDKELEGHLGLPPLPVGDFHLTFTGGAQAALVTPPVCGTYNTEADFTPSASPFLADSTPSSAFQIIGGVEGAACPTLPLPYSPSLIAGATTDQAGGYTDFSMLLRVGDGQQNTSTLQFTTPPGLLGTISSVSLCQEPQASEGECPASSQIGHTVVASGPGPYPLVIPEPGQPPAPIYLTGPYDGAPFGLSIVVPIIAGPFDLGTEVVRSRIDVNPYTAQITITTNPLPQIIHGVPTDLRTINAVIEREHFMFNPTNCNPFSFSGTAIGSEGAQAPLETHFQVGSCRSLTFKPDFKVSTQAKTSRKEGASLEAQIIYPTTPPGKNQASSQANIHTVKVELPKQLPSRLTTLQKACPAATFEANPASCPPGSVVGHATAITPVLPVALTGPAYFVSHGGEAFPTLIIVLQGYGVTVDVVGTTFISKQGITSSTFRQVPDVPINSFELTLPQGSDSALAANGNLCNARNLTMPTEFIAQNGLAIHENTRIAVTGCPKIRKAAKHKHHKAAKR